MHTEQIQPDLNEPLIPVSARMNERERLAIRFLAAHWGVSMAEAMRRAIREAADRISLNAPQAANQGHDDN